MSESKIYARTEIGNAELTKSNGKIAGDEKRLMLLVDGASSVEDIGKKVPPSVRKHIDDVFGLLLRGELGFHPLLVQDDLFFQGVIAGSNHA